LNEAIFGHYSIYLGGFVTADQERPIISITASSVKVHQVRVDQAELEGWFRCRKAEIIVDFARLIDDIQCR
jgi:hypothetical protein